MFFSKKKVLKGTPPTLSRNLLTQFGWLLTVIIASLMAVLTVSDILFHSGNVYNGIITYMILPGFLSGSVALIFFGIFLEWRRRHKKNPGEYPALPVLDLNKRWQRRRLLLGAIFISFFFSVSAIIAYHSYHFTESTEFCGKTCHVVMEPEYVAYQHSPHSRVLCVECHIGPGAEFFVKAKVSGLKQVVAVVTKSYTLPIEVPVHNLRPAQDTCEHCHWPEKFFDSVEKIIWHFSPDQSNTPVRYNLLLKVGGGTSALGQGKGIHWHSSSDVQVRYWPADYKRSVIPWIEVTTGSGKPRVYRTPDCPDPLPPEAEAQIRTMDCIDCHNRPSHIYRSPRQLIDTALGTGALDSSLPYLKRYATEIFEQKYETKAAALENISKALEEKYAARMAGPRGAKMVRENIKLLQDLYRQNFFPDHGVDWREYPVHLGHFESRGCNRCHDGLHQDAEDRPISNSCELCHDLVDQTEGEAVFSPAEYKRRPFQHPRNLGNIWEGYECSTCHGLESSLITKDDLDRLTIGEAGESKRNTEEGAASSH